MTKKDFKILLFCLGLVCIGFMYDVACKNIMDIMDSQTDTIKAEIERYNHVMGTIEV